MGNAASADSESGSDAQLGITRLLRSTADVVSDAVAEFVSDAASVRAKGERPGQYALDLVADAAALSVLSDAGVGILSEESGLTAPRASSEPGGIRGALTVVVDPVDGSTNASRRIPWYAISLCAVDDSGPWVSLVQNLATGTRWEAVRNAGATRDGEPISPADTTALDQAVLVLNGYPGNYLGWKQYRALGATALDLCAVADGSVDATIDFSGALGPWDYMGAQLIITEAGGVIEDSGGEELVALDHLARRSPRSAANPELMASLRVAHKSAAAESVLWEDSPR